MYYVSYWDMELIIINNITINISLHLTFFDYRRAPFSCGIQIHDWGQEPKELVLYEGAEHRLEECGTELEELLFEWIPKTLTSVAS